jgi:quercetin dioxygenase-like cupin family protein
MKIFRFDKDVGKSITAFGSTNLSMSKIIRSSGESHIGCMHLTHGGTVGGHVAPTNQLFLVTQGEVQVRSADKVHNDTDPWMEVLEGQAVFWKEGEWHETRTTKGATAVVIECPGIEPEDMTEK